MPNTTIIGNLLDIEVGVIAHQTNCIGLAGPVLAYSLAQKYPSWHTAYRAMCNGRGIEMIFGRAHFYQATDTLYIASLFGQKVPGRGLMTDYQALASALKELHHMCPKGVPIYLPYKLGCGNAGGNWDLVESLISINCPGGIIVKLPQ
jgi:hypothetical protein